MIDENNEKKVVYSKETYTYVPKPKTKPKPQKKKEKEKLTPTQSRLRDIRRNADHAVNNAMKNPDRIRQEEAFAEQHRNDTDEELYEYVKNMRRTRGRKLARKTFIGYAYVTKRLGPWNDFMDKICRELKAEEAAKAETEKDEW